MGPWQISLFSMMAAVVTGVALRNSIRRRSAFRGAAEALGLRSRPWWKGPVQLSGKLEGVFVRVSIHPKQRLLVLAAQDPSLVPAALQVQPRTPWTSAARAILGSPLRTFDPALDDVALIEGPEAEIFARLSEQARRLLYQSVAGNLDIFVRDGRVFSGARILDQDAESLALQIRAMALVNGALALCPWEVPGRLEEHCKRGPDPFRQRCLELLAEHHPDHAAYATALRKALEDPSPALRLAAALRVGDAEALPHLRQLVLDWRLEKRSRVIVLERLLEKLPEAEHVPIFEALLGDPDEDLRRWSADRLRAMRHPRAEGGQLALVEGGTPDGALSIASQPGALSAVPSPEPPQDATPTEPLRGGS